jgi:hypothetical protein
MRVQAKPLNTRAVAKAPQGVAPFGRSFDHGGPFW